LKPLVSILIPAYNSQEWIADTLETAVGQTWPRKEIIIVDDGSKDNTLAIAKQFESSSVKILSQKNQGAAAARNQALSQCQGDYIQWLDADDLLSLDKISLQMEAMEQCENKRTLLSCPWGLFLYRPRRAKFEPSPLWQDLSPAEWLLRKLQENRYMQTATWLVSREMTAAAGPWDTTLHVDDDGEYFCRILLQSEGVRFVPEAKVYYRKAGARNLSYIGHSSKKMEAQWTSMLFHIRSLRSLDDSERARAACVRYLNDSMPNFYPERPDLISQMKTLAEELGGTLRAPHLPWKYSWIESLFGWNMAKRAQLILPQLRWSLARSWDKALYDLEERKHSNDPASPKQRPPHVNGAPESPVH
jgi:glycosyltransferase involved in cell wall biosynthesis